MIVIARGWITEFGGGALFADCNDSSAKRMESLHAPTGARSLCSGITCSSCDNKGPSLKTARDRRDGMLPCMSNSCTWLSRTSLLALQGNKHQFWSRLDCCDLSLPMTESKQRRWFANSWGWPFHQRLWVQTKHMLARHQVRPPEPFWHTRGIHHCTLYQPKQCRQVFLHLAPTEWQYHHVSSVTWFTIYWVWRSEATTTNQDQFNPWRGRQKFATTQKKVTSGTHLPVVGRYNYSF